MRYLTTTIPPRGQDPGRPDPLVEQLRDQMHSRQGKAAAVDGFDVDRAGEVVIEVNDTLYKIRDFEA